MNLEKSQEYYSRASGLIPCRTQTLSKGPTQFVQGISPIYLKKGKGAYVWDVDGNKFIDFPLALGAVTIGHADDDINESVISQVKDGVNFSLMHPLEVELAEKLRKIIPCAESIRYSKTGSEVTSAAVRIARAYTGKEKIAHCGYHGWHDWHIGGTEHHRGVPASTRELLVKFKYNEIESLEKLFDENKNQIAAVILEPMGIELPKNDFLSQVKKITHENQALLIFDEMVTGFRIDLGGAQKYFNITPDLSTFGKGIGNGYPLSLVVGKEEYMQVCEKIFFSTTFGGEVASLAAANAVVEKMQAKSVIQHMWQVGRQFQDGFNKIAREQQAPCECKGLPVHNAISFNVNPDETTLYRSLFLQTPVQHGALISGVQNFCYAHTSEDINNALAACSLALEKLMQAQKSGQPMQHLQGEAVKPVFRNP